MNEYHERRVSNQKWLSAFLFVQRFFWNEFAKKFFRQNEKVSDTRLRLQQLMGQTTSTKDKTVLVQTVVLFETLVKKIQQLQDENQKMKSAELDRDQMVLELESMKNQLEIADKVLNSCFFSYRPVRRCCSHAILPNKNRLKHFGSKRWPNRRSILNPHQNTWKRHSLFLSPNYKFAYWPHIVFSERNPGWVVSDGW